MIDDPITTVEFREVGEGLWIWRQEHYEWGPGAGWDAVVTSTWAESGGERFVFDPLAPLINAEQLWEWLDQRPPTAAAVLKPDHVRNVDLFIQRYGAQGFGPDRFFRGGGPESDLVELWPGYKLPGGVVALFDGRGRNETPMWLPDQRVIVFADALTERDGELRVWGTPWFQEGAVAAMRSLLELPFEQIIISHGEPVHSRIEYEKALKRDAWWG